MPRKKTCGWFSRMAIAIVNNRKIAVGLYIYVSFGAACYVVYKKKRKCSEKKKHDEEKLAGGFPGWSQLYCRVFFFLHGIIKISDSPWKKNRRNK